MDFQIIWSPFALAEVAAAVEQLSVDSPAAGEALRADLVESVAALKRFPFIGPVYERDDSGRTREIVCRRHRVFYRVDESAGRVDIVTVRHSSRGEPRLPRS